jgi:hypothetical protein
MKHPMNNHRRKMWMEEDSSSRGARIFPRSMWYDVSLLVKKVLYYIEPKGTCSIFSHDTYERLEVVVQRD